MSVLPALLDGPRAQVFIRMTIRISLCADSKYRFTSGLF